MGSYNCVRRPTQVAADLRLVCAIVLKILQKVSHIRLDFSYNVMTFLFLEILSFVSLGRHSSKLPCYVFCLKIGKLVELANHRVCVLRWLQISGHSVIWTGLEALELRRLLLLFDSVGNQLVSYKWNSLQSGEDEEILRCSQSRKVNLIPTKCRQSCLRDGHQGTVIYKLHHLNW